MAQTLGSEIILQVDSIDKNDDFVRGMMYWNILNPILYALDYWFINITNHKTADGYQGDIRGIEHYSDKKTANIFAASMVTIAGHPILKFSGDSDDMYSRDKKSVDELRSRLLISQFGFRETQHEKITHHRGNYLIALHRFGHIFNPV